MTLAAAIAMPSVASAQITDLLSPSRKGCLDSLAFGGPDVSWKSPPCQLPHALESLRSSHTVPVDRALIADALGQRPTTSRQILSALSEVAGMSLPPNDRREVAAERAALALQRLAENPETQKTVREFSYLLVWAYYGTRSSDVQRSLEQAAAALGKTIVALRAGKQVAPELHGRKPSP